MSYQFLNPKMEELQKLVTELDERHHALEAESTAVYRQLEEAQEKLALERMKSIEDYIPYYTKKLERLKTYIEGFEQDYPGNTVNYTFEKQETPYKGDFYEVIQDPLDYLIGEYDCLGMTKFLEIVFEYHNESVKTFVQKWMRKNILQADYYDDKKQLYNQHLSGKK